MEATSSHVLRVALFATGFALVDGCGWPVFSCRAEEKLPEKAAVISAVREYVSSIQSIQVHFSLWQKGVLVAKHMGVSEETEVGPLSLEWAEQGRQKLLRTNVERGAIGWQPTHKTFDSCDGQLAYQVTYDSQDGGKVESVRRMAAHPNDFTSKTNLPEFCALRVPLMKGTLCDLLSLDSAKIVGMDVLFSSRCLHVSVPAVSLASEMEEAVDVWLDMDHDFLPRRFVTRTTNNAPGIARKFRNMEATSEAPELQDVRDELLDRLRWFPRVVTGQGQYGATRLIVDSVVLNRRLPTSLFQPVMPVGTVIIDGIDKMYVPAKVSVVGGSNAATALVDQRLRDAANLAVPQATRPAAPHGYVDANASRDWNWRVTVSVVCLLVLAGVGVRSWWFRA